MSSGTLKIKPSVPLPMGWIPYWNLRPLGMELKKLSGKEIEFHSGAPALVNKMLSDGKVRVAPCSSVCLLKNSTHQLAYPLGVASTGPVKSVYIGFHHSQLEIYKEIKKRHAEVADIFQRGIRASGSDIRKSADLIWNACAKLPTLDINTPEIIMTPASAASATLTRILYRLWFGEAPKEISPKADHLDYSAANFGDDQPIELLIGDEALIRRPSFAKIIDLGDAWTNLTNLPFVFAVWQSNRIISPYWGTMISEAAIRAQTKMHVDALPYLPENNVTDVAGHPIDLGAYWKHIQYKLNAPHFHGLTLFLALARQLNPKSVDDQAVRQLLKCQELALPAFQ
jgi:predicted solute-binding protein